MYMEGEKLQTTEERFLLSAMQRGDLKAYGVLFRRYYPMLCAYATKFVELKDAEEIVQDVMLWLWENRETQTFETSLSQYLFKTVYHRAINLIVRHQSQLRADTLFYENMQEMLQDTDFYQLEELQKRIREAVDALPPTYREAFVMHRFDNKSYKEIAEILQVSQKTVDYRIQQALKQLRITLKDYLPLISCRKCNTHPLFPIRPMVTSLRLSNLIFLISTTSFFFSEAW